MTLLSLAILTSSAPLARADSPSETLEKAIYSEETKGDLDGAMTLYQQVIEQAKTSKALAAQAQYRLGVCQYKKRNYSAATASFETLVKDYPDEKELVALARDYLARNNDLLAAPWAGGEEERWDIKLAGGLKVGFGVLTADAAESHGQKIWRLGLLMSAAGSGQASHVEVDAATMKPIHGVWKHSLLGEADAVYASDHADLKMTGKEDVSKITLSGPVYDNEESYHLFRRLPLAVGYKSTVPVFSSLGGGSVISLNVEVTGTETVTVPAGTYPCYRLDLHIGQVFWISTNAARDIVKIEGGGVIMELTGVRHRNASDPVNYVDADGFSLTAPPGWVIGSLAQEKTKTSVLLLDPALTGTCVLDWSALETIEPKTATNSARALLEKETADGAKQYKNFQVRADSWQERIVAGQPAMSVIADCVDGDKPKIGYGVTTIVAGHAAAFQFLVPAADFEAFRPTLDAIVDSFKMK
ncbi:MAG TPA: tetratricopeptide repeat protein [Candidatus Acidoferrum sp.]|nr:tetratricopeptide repeat protein [Candidatus Acidoferrum sp.]